MKVYIDAALVRLGVPFVCTWFLGPAPVFTSPLDFLLWPMTACPD